MTFTERLKLYKKDIDSIFEIKGIVSGDINNTIDSIKKDLLNQVDSQIDIVCNSIDAPIKIGIEGESTHGIKEFSKQLLGFNGFDKIQSIENNNNIIFDIWYSMTNSTTEIFNQSNGRKIELDDESTKKNALIDKAKEFVSDNILTNPIQYNITIPAPKEDFFRKACEHNVHFIIFPGRNTKENDSYNNSLDLILAIIDYDKMLGKDKIIKDAIKDNNKAPFIPVIKHSSDNTEIMQNVLSNFPELREFSATNVQIIGNDYHELEGLKKQLVDFFDIQGQLSPYNQDSVNIILKHHQQIINESIDKLSQLFDRLNTELVYTIASNTLDVDNLFKEIEPSRIKLRKNCDSSVEVFRKTALKDIDKRLSKARTQKEISHVLDEVSSDKGFFTTQLNSTLNIDKKINEFKARTEDAITKRIKKTVLEKNKSTMISNAKHKISQMEVPLDDIFKLDYIKEQLKECKSINSEKIRIGHGFLYFMGDIGFILGLLGIILIPFMDGYLKDYPSSIILIPILVFVLSCCIKLSRFIRIRKVRNAKKNRMIEIIDGIQVNAIKDDLEKRIEDAILKLKEALKPLFNDFTEYDQDVKRLNKLKEEYQQKMQEVKEYIHADSKSIVIVER